MIYTLTRDFVIHKHSPIAIALYQCYINSTGGDMVDKSYKEIKKRHIGYIISFIFFIIVGFIFVFFTDIFPEPQYNDLLSKTITIEDIHITSSNRDRFWVPTEYNFTISTAANEKYHFSSQLPEGKTIESKLQEGTIADIKYYKNAWFPIYYIEELSIDNETIYPYEYTADTNKTEGFKIAVFLWIFALFQLCYYFYIVNKDINKQKNKEIYAKKKGKKQKRKH